MALIRQRLCWALSARQQGWQQQQQGQAGQAPRGRTFRDAARKAEKESASGGEGEGAQRLVKIVRGAPGHPGSWRGGGAGEADAVVVAEGPPGTTAGLLLEHNDCRGIESRGRTAGYRGSVKRSLGRLQLQPPSAAAPGRQASRRVARLNWFGHFGTQVQWDPPGRPGRRTGQRCRRCWCSGSAGHWPRPPPQQAPAR